MNDSTYLFDVLDLPSAPDHLLHSLHDLQAAVDAERFPADPPKPLTQRLVEWRIGGSCAVATDIERSTILGSVWIDLPEEAHDCHVVGFNMQVLQTARRQGIGRHLLRAVNQIAYREQRPLLMTQTQRRVPAGGAFMERIGARPSIESRTLQLKLHGYDPDLQRWCARAQERVPGWQIGFWEDTYPDADIEMIARLHEVHNDAPHRSASIGDRVITKEHLRDEEQAMRARRDVRWTAYVRDPATGLLVGFTECTWNTHEPGNVEQGTTAVLPAYRRRGLGHWLKAALLDKLVREQPAAEFVRTGNAATNTAMLALNADLHFEVISEDTWWEVERERVRDYLDRQ